MPEKVHRCVEELMTKKGYSKEKAIKICQVSTGQSYNAKESMELLEVSRPQGFNVDREACMIRDVRILGPQSRNGRQYTSDAIRSAQTMYEGSVVNYDHPDRTNPRGERSVDDRAGWLQNTRIAADGGLLGDFHFLKSDPRAEKICEAAERRPELFGLSHNVDGRITRQNGKVLVEEITKVRSVDVVSDPASTRSLFESIEQENNVMTISITEYLDTQNSEHPGVKLLREFVEIGIVKSEFQVDEETSGRFARLWEGKWTPKASEKDDEKDEKKDDALATDPTLAKLLEGQESLQKQLTEMKGQLNVQKPQSGMPLNEGDNGNGDGEKSTDAKDFCRRITSR